MPWLDMERSLCISADLLQPDESIADGLKLVAHPIEKLLLVITQTLFVTSDGVI